MEVILVKGCKNGYSYEKVFVNGEELHFHTASRRLTGADGEDGCGIFQNGSTSITKGGASNTFVFAERAEFATPEYVEILKRRIAEVREWVQNLDYERQVSFLVQEP